MINAVAHASITGASVQTDGYVSVRSQSMRGTTQTMMTHAMTGRREMEIIRRDITEERYKELEEMTYAEQRQSLFPDGLPEDWEYGYGYYGHALIQVGDKYMVQFKIGSSCD
jgi:hypothetical protein